MLLIKETKSLLDPSQLVLLVSALIISWKEPSHFSNPNSKGATLMSDHLFLTCFMQEVTGRLQWEDTGTCRPLIFNLVSVVYHKGIQTSDLVVTNGRHCTTTPQPQAHTMAFQNPLNITINVCRHDYPN